MITLQRKNVPPSIWMVYFKTILNAWGTARRLDSLPDAKTLEHCPFCANGPDSLEHFATCSVTRHLYSQHDCPSGDLLLFSGLDQDARDHRIVIVVRLLSVLFVVHCTIVHDYSDMPPLDTVQRLIASAVQSIFPR